MKMTAGELKQQLAVAHAEGAEHNERAIQASTQVEGFQTQVWVSMTAYTTNPSDTSRGQHASCIHCGRYSTTN